MSETKRASPVSPAAGAVASPCRALSRAWGSTRSCYSFLHPCSRSSASSLHPATAWKRRNVIIFGTPRADSWGLKEINLTSTSLVSQPPKKVNPGESGRPGHPAELHDVQLTAADKGAVILPLPPIPESQLGRENTTRNPGVGSLVHFLFFF